MLLVWPLILLVKKRKKKLLYSTPCKHGVVGTWCRFCATIINILHCFGWSKCWIRWLFWKMCACLQWGGLRVVVAGWPSWLPRFARSAAPTAYSEPGIPAVTQHRANKGRHSTDIEKYSTRISGDDPDPLVSAHHIMWVEICRLGEAGEKEARKGAGFSRQAWRPHLRLSRCNV